MVLRRPNRSLRSTLVALLLATTVPLVLMALANAWISFRAERDRLERSTEAVARGVALGVALEVQRGMAGLGALSLSRPLCSNDLAGFRRQLQHFMKTQHPGGNAILADPAGAQLINLLAPAGQRLPRRRHVEWMQESFARGAPVVSDVYAGTFQDRVVTLEVPVYCEGVPRYHLALVPPMEVFQAVLDQQRPPQGWSLLLVDRHGELIARAGASGRFNGSPGLAFARDLVDSAGEQGALRRIGSDAFAYSKVGEWGWGVLIQRPLDGVNAALARSVLLVLLSGLLTVLVGAALALSLARSLVRPVERLSRLASGGEPLPASSLPPSGVREIDAVADRLQQAMRELQRADRRKDDFIATLAHELRNPLAPTLNALTLLQRKESLSDEGRRLTEVAQRQLAQMKRLIQDLLELARLGQGKLSLELARVDLRAPLRASLDSVAARLDERGQSLAVDLPDGPLPVHGDELRLTQVFSNLLDNASKYSLQGGSVKLRAAREAGRVRVDVTDEGRGLDREQAARVFDLYWQAGAAGASEGMGIGLALVKRLVDAHGGSVRASSPGPGQGSTFTVWLPQAPAADAAGPGGTRADPAGGG